MAGRELGYVYFVYAPEVERVKIGRAIDPFARLLAMQTGSPVELKLLAAVVGGAREESRLHRRFAAYLWRGEWFAATEPLLRFIREIGDWAGPDGDDVYRFCERIASFEKGFYCAGCGREFGGPILCYLRKDDHVIHVCLRCGSDDQGDRIKVTFQPSLVIAPS